MSLEETKTFSFNLSPTLMWGILLTVVTSGSGAAYYGITYFNRMDSGLKLIEEAKPYDDADLRTQVNELKVQLAAQQQSVNTVKDSMVVTSNQLVSMQEKVSNAIGTANEAKAITNGNVRETAASLLGVREEMKATRDGLEAQLKAVKRATSNPLGN